MLVLTRKEGECLLVQKDGNEMVLEIRKVRGRHVSMSFKCGKEWKIRRKELDERPERKNSK